MTTTAHPVLTFINPATGHEYQGGNVQRLQDCADSNPRFITGAFATFRQWLTVGRVVRKGEKAACQLLAFTDHKSKAEQPAPIVAAVKPSDAQGAKAVRFCRTFLVFALEQTEALPDAKPDAPAEEHNPASEPAAAVETPPAPSAPTGKPVLAMDRIQAKADRLMEQARECFADRLQNTPKRLAQAMRKRLEGQRLERASNMLRAMLAAPAGFWDGMANVTTADVITWAQEAACFQTAPVSNGYHGYEVETDKPRHTEAHHVALRSLLDPRAVADSSAKIKRERAEAELRNCDFPGFFPTPPDVIRTMLEYVGDLRGKSVLEPSAGKGDLVRAAFDWGAKSVRSFEIVPRLADYLHQFVQVTGADRCHVTQNADFLEAAVPPAPGLVDAVLMNPPYERDAAPRHVLAALGWLKPGGRLVAVMPSNWEEKASAEPLHLLLGEQGRAYMTVEIDGAPFANATAFRQTGVRVALLVVS